jgi:hypothetical protein
VPSLKQSVGTAASPVGFEPGLAKQVLADAVSGQGSARLGAEGSALGFESAKVAKRAVQPFWRRRTLVSTAARPSANRA